MPATPEFFSTVRELCDETGALMIVDEVQVRLAGRPPAAAIRPQDSELGVPYQWQWCDRMKSNFGSCL